MFALKKQKNKYGFLLGFCALIVAIAFVSVGVTMAVWSGSTRESNVVTIGNVRIELIDIYPDEDPVLVPDNDVTVDKTVSVKNIGVTDCYVRLLISKGWYDKNGNLDSSVSADFIDPVFDTTGNWVKGTALENYPDYDVYYYQKVLPAGAPAEEPLFEKFYFLESIQNGDETISFNLSRDGGKTGSIKVFAQAVQSEYLGQEGTDFGLKRTNGRITGWPNDLVFN